MNNNVKDILNSAKTVLLNAGIPDNRDAEFILEYVLGSKIATLGNKALTDEELDAFNALILRRANREPLDSILGGTEFIGLNIPFSTLTLTPRQETEIMTDTIIKENKHRTGLKVLDLCCGSGCIGLSVKKYLTGASVTLADISTEVLEVAKHNSRVNGIDVNFIRSDLFESIGDSYDIIISNPPYIPSADIACLEKEVLDYDPLLALDGGIDGLDLYRKISDNINSHLNENGLVYIEFGINQTEDIIDIFKNSLKNIEIIKDYSGIDRYLKARKKDVN